MAVFKPQSPAIVPNPSNTINTAISDGFDYILSSPTFPEVSLSTPLDITTRLAPYISHSLIKVWSRNPTSVKALAETSGIVGIKYMPKLHIVSDPI